MTVQVELPDTRTQIERDIEAREASEREARWAKKDEGAKIIAAEYGEQLRGLKGREANEIVKKLAAERGIVAYWSDVKHLIQS